jgi:hypothetical protein
MATVFIADTFYPPGAGHPHAQKLIWDCFRLADTPEAEAAFKFALPIVNRMSW